MNSTSLFQKAGTCFIAGLTTIALLLVLGNSGTLKWFPPGIVFSFVGLFFISSLIFPFIWHRQEKHQKVNSQKTYALLYGIIRYTIAFNLASFGWKKLFGLQFNVPTEVSDKPMNEQSGEWLTWYYFGYSVAFGVVLSVIQIVGACLLLFRKTMLLGCITLFAFMLNLTLINIFYKMNAGALVQSVILTMGLLFLMLIHYKIFVAFFLKAKSRLPALNYSATTKNVLRISAILLSLAFTMYLKSLAN